ncbi:MAG: hypothetical protein IIC64_15785 [SAR324 cluster bacterium]|nr:hypothetical protein [SAR324 cluster bacterium]
MVYVKGRRAGGTHGAAIRLVEIAHLQKGSSHLWVDTTHRNIERYLRRYFFRALRGTRFHWNQQRKTLTFEGGGYCDFGSASRPENLEGFGYDYIWINEAGILLKDEALFYSTLSPMMMESPKAQVFIIGAPKGPGLFQRMYDWGQDEMRPEWASFRHASHLNPLLPRSALEEMRANMPERVYRQEVLAEFVEGEGSVFRNVSAIVRPGAEPEAVAPDVSYVLGIDLARHTDFTVIWAGRADTCHGVACERFRRIPWERQVARIAYMARKYHDAPIYADATGMGDPVVEDLAREGLQVQGIKFTKERKRQIIDHLAIGIERERLTIIPHDQTVRELHAYEYRQLPTGHLRSEGGGGQHDDCVIALALCYWGMSAREPGFILGSKMVTSELD